MQASRVLSCCRQHREIGGWIAGKARGAVGHALCEDLGGFRWRGLEVEVRACGDAELGAFVERGGAEGDCGGEGHAPEGDSFGINGILVEEEGQRVGVVGHLVRWVDFIAREAIAFPYVAGIVDQRVDACFLELLSNLGNEHLLYAGELVKLA